MGDQKKPAALYFTTVAANSEDFAVFGGHVAAEESDPTFTRLVVYNGGRWGLLGDLTDVVYALRTRDGSGDRRNLCALGREGLFREFVPGRGPTDIPLDREQVGYLEDLRPIGDALYACAAQGQVYTLRGPRWTAMHQGLVVPFAGRVERCLLSIDGRSGEDITTAGEGGIVWHWDGNAWRQLDAPTNLAINSVLCTAAGDTYFAGESGLLLRLTKDGKWIDLSQPDVTENPFRDMREYRGGVVLAAEDRLVTTDGRSLQEVAPPPGPDPTIVALDVAAGSVWCVGDERVRRFDGTDWHEYICPDNQ